jgi:hypothetical protein
MELTKIVGEGVMSSGKEELSKYVFFVKIKENEFKDHWCKEVPSQIGNAKTKSEK